MGGDYNSIEDFGQLPQIQLDMFYLFDESCLHMSLPLPKLDCVGDEDKGRKEKEQRRGKGQEGSACHLGCDVWEVDSGNV